MAAKPDYPVGYLAQLTEPFTRRGGCESTADATLEKTAETTVTVRDNIAGPPIS